MLDQGVHVLKVDKEPPALISHVRTPLEEWLTDTDAAMLGHGPGEAAPFTDLPAASAADVEELADAEVLAEAAGVTDAVA